MEPRFKIGDRVVYWHQDGSCNGAPPVWAIVLEVLPNSKFFHDSCYLLVIKREGLYEQSWEDLETSIDGGEVWVVNAVGEDDLSKDMTIENFDPVRIDQCYLPKEERMSKDHEDELEDLWIDYGGEG